MITQGFFNECKGLPWLYPCAVGWCVSRARRHEKKEMTGAGTPQQDSDPVVRVEPGRAPVYFIVFFALLFLVYIKIAALNSAGPTWYVFDFIERFRIFGVDDIYRYYIARSGWLSPETYSWGYVLPVGVFLDGALSWVFSGNIFLMRCVHAFMSCASLWLLLWAGISAGVNRFLMLISCLVIGFMPLYAFVSLSFLGESWLLFLVCGSLFLFIKGYWRCCALLVGLLPLARPEGIFILGPVFLFFVSRKDFRSAAITVAPGGLFFIYLSFMLPHVMIFSEWRFELRKLLNLVRDPLAFRVGIFSTFNALWLLPAIAGLFVPKMRRFWPFSAGTLFSIVLVIFLLLLRLANYEPRYLIFVMPVLALSWAMLVDYILEIKALMPVRTGIMFLLAVLTLIAVFDNFLQVDFLKAKYGGGARWPVSGISALPRTFGSYGEERAGQRRALAREIEKLLVDQPAITSLMVSNPEVLLDIDPARLPATVRVVLVQVDYDLATRFMNGHMLGLFSHSPQYAYFNMVPALSLGAANSLYIGQMNCQACSPLRREGEFAVYAVSAWSP